MATGVFTYTSYTYTAPNGNSISGKNFYDYSGLVAALLPYGGSFSGIGTGSESHTTGPGALLSSFDIPSRANLIIFSQSNQGPPPTQNVGPFNVISGLNNQSGTGMILSAVDYGFLATNVAPFTVTPSPPPLTSSNPNVTYQTLAQTLGIFDYTYNGQTPQTVSVSGLQVTVNAWNPASPNLVAPFILNPSAPWPPGSTPPPPPPPNFSATISLASSGKSVNVVMTFTEFNNLPTNVYQVTNLSTTTAAPTYTAAQVIAALAVTPPPPPPTTITPPVIQGTSSTGNPSVLTLGWNLPSGTPDVIIIYVQNPVGGTSSIPTSSSSGIYQIIGLNSTGVYTITAKFQDSSTGNTSALSNTVTYNRPAPPPPPPPSTLNPPVLTASAPTGTPLQITLGWNTPSNNTADMIKIYGKTPDMSSYSLIFTDRVSQGAQVISNLTVLGLYSFKANFFRSSDSMTSSDSNIVTVNTDTTRPPPSNGKNYLKILGGFFALGVTLSLLTGNSGNKKGIKKK